MEGRSWTLCGGDGVNGDEPRRVSWKTPLIFQSKLLCLSLLYLATSLFISLNVTSSQIGCLFRLPSHLYANSHRRLEEPLFSYPPAYGEQKHAFPSSSTSASCDSAVLFPDYLPAFGEILRLARNASYSSPIKYMSRRKTTFGGNFSILERISYFDIENGGGRGDGERSPEVPCGFFKEFPVSPSDRAAMERCRGVVVASAIFGDHDKLRQPRGLGVKTLETVCFFVFVDDATIHAFTRSHILPTTQREEEDNEDAGDRASKIGVWRVVRLPTEALPYSNPAMNGVVPKHLLHRLFPGAKFSIWVDGKMQLTADPILLIHSLLIAHEADMAVSQHPLNLHTMEEAIATARWRKWPDVQELREQMETYCENGLLPWSSSKLPYTSDVPDTALILRRHGQRSDLFSCLMFNELDAFNPRDQLPFAYVRDFMRPKVRINMFSVAVLEQITVEYRHNLKQNGGGGVGMREKRGSSRGLVGSRCEGYLRKMWGEEANDD